MAKKETEPAKIANYATTDVEQDTVVLVVRPKNTYGAAKAGSLVRVDKVELKNRSTMSACMTLEDRDKKAAEKAAKAAAKAKPNPRTVKAIVEAGLERIEKQAQEKQASQHS